MTLLILAYLGGALTILSPCILPVLPFVLSGSGQPFLRGRGNRARALACHEQALQHFAVLVVEIGIEQCLVEGADHGSQPTGGRCAQGQQQFVGRNVHQVHHSI